MSELVTIRLAPLDQVLKLARGARLQDVLFEKGVEFPCGGRGRCTGCKIQVLAGSLPITPEDRHKLTAAELEAGWRLACRARAEHDATLVLAQWETPILTDDSPLLFQPRDGLGIAIDLGTTTIAAQLLNLRTGQVMAVRTALNSQAQHGADIMSRVEFAVEGGQKNLEELTRTQLGRLVAELMNEASPESLEAIVVVGNTVMHHLFCGVAVEPLSHVPFEPPSPGLRVFTPAELGWKAGKSTRVFFLPCLGGFVGSDLLAGVLATGMAESDSLAALFDLGTNGEIVLGNRTRILCASTAAGPAFEGARLSMGMRAATGAIWRVRAENGALHSRVLGNGPARGLCGSGLVDAVASGLELGQIQSSGRLRSGTSLPLIAPVSLAQRDIRELQLAKGAIAAGFKVLLEEWGATLDAVRQVHLAGAFGNYINVASARRIGLLAVPADKVRPAGNTALLGAKLALFNLPRSGAEFADVLGRVEHIALHERPRFQEQFVEEMTFPKD